MKSYCDMSADNFPGRAVIPKILRRELRRRRFSMIFSGPFSQSTAPILENGSDLRGVQPATVSRRILAARQYAGRYGRRLGRSSASILSGSFSTIFFDFWRYQPTKAQIQYSTTAATWDAFDPPRYSPGSPELADMQDATGNRRVGMLGGREYSACLGGLDGNFSAETATGEDPLLDNCNDLKGSNSASI